MTEAQRGQRVLLSFIACKGQTEYCAAWTCIQCFFINIHQLVSHLEWYNLEKIKPIFNC